MSRMINQVVTHRFMWWAPWGITRWWLPRMFLGGDEWCNVPWCVNVPPLGCFIFFKPLGQLRKFPCATHWWEMYQEEQADYAPCGWLRGGQINKSNHIHAELDALCPEAWSWLLGGEAERERSLEH